MQLALNCISLKGVLYFVRSGQKNRNLTNWEKKSVWFDDKVICLSYVNWNVKSWNIGGHRFVVKVTVINAKFITGERNLAKSLNRKGASTTFPRSVCSLHNFVQFYMHIRELNIFIGSSWWWLEAINSRVG